VLKPDFSVQPQPRTRGGQPGARQAFRPGPAGVQQEQQPQRPDPRARRNVGSQAQPQRQALNQGNRQSAPAAGQSQGRGSNRGQAQGSSNNQSQDAQRNQSRGESKKKDTD
jgi:hypothetical protein